MDEERRREAEKRKAERAAKEARENAELDRRAKLAEAEAQRQALREANAAAISQQRRDAAAAMDLAGDDGAGAGAPAASWAHSLVSLRAIPADKSECASKS